MKVVVIVSNLVLLLLFACEQNGGLHIRSDKFQWYVNLENPSENQIKEKIQFFDPDYNQDSLYREYHKRDSIYGYIDGYTLQKNYMQRIDFQNDSSASLIFHRAFKNEKTKEKRNLLVKQYWVKHRNEWFIASKAEEFKEIKQ